MELDDAVDTEALEVSVFDSSEVLTREARRNADWRRAVLALACAEVTLGKRR